jgi:glucose-6-phosphate isomerase
LAHVDGGVPNLIVELDEMNEYTFGEMVYFFEKACGISGHLLGLNPFDQPEVELIRRICLPYLASRALKKKGIN